MMFDDESFKSVGFLRYAREYFDCAKTLKELKSERFGFVFVPPKPALYCLIQSVELTVKAFLLYRGVSLDALGKKSLGHRQIKLYAEARKKGLPPQSNLRLSAIRLMQYANENHRLRYRGKAFFEQALTMQHWDEIEAYQIKLYNYVAQEIEPQFFTPVTPSEPVTASHGAD
jgi:hypothetical protein